MKLQVKVLDKRIGAQLELLFYGEKGYEESLRFFYKNHSKNPLLFPYFYYNINIIIF